MKDPLKSFLDFYNSKKMQSGMNSVKDRKARVQAQFNEMDYKVNVHLCWVLMWITTLSYQDDIEKRFRLK